MKNWIKNTAVFLISQCLSLFGSSLVQYAITWHVTLETKSGFYATLMIICGFLPTLLLSPFAGVWADRYDRKKLIMVSDGAIALSTLILAVLFILGHNYMWLLFVTAAIRSVGTAVQTPCVGAMLPDIVPEKQLTRVNGINGTVQSVITLASPMVSGALLSVTNLENIFFIDVVTAAIAIGIMILFLKIPKREEKNTNGKPDYFGELKQGFSYIKRHKYLTHFFIFCAFFCFMAAPVAFLTPLQTTRVFGDDVWRLTAIEITFSIGMIIGGIAVSVWGGFKNKLYTVAAAGILMGLMTFALGFPFHFWVYLGFMILAGVSMPLFNTPAMTLLQERVDPDYIGRVFGVMTMINSGMMPIGMLVFGPLADMMQIEYLLIVTGLFIAAMSVMLLYNKPLLKAGVKEPEPQPNTE